MFSRSLTLAAQDEALVMLPRALNGKLMLPLLAAAAGVARQDYAQLTCTASVISHKPGRRCTIRYTLTGADKPGHLVSARTFLGKVYTRPALAERLYQRLESLKHVLCDSAGPVQVPAPVALVHDLGLVLLKYADGADLHAILMSEKSNRPFALAAHWLASLHAAHPLAELKAADAPHELQKVDRWCERIAPCLTQAERRRLSVTQATLHALGRKTPAGESVMVHRDFYHGNVLWDGRAVWILDFDELAAGDPALDVGHFVAHMETLALRTPGLVEVAAKAAVLFRRSYQERASFDTQSRVPFYKAYTFLKLAATEVARQQEKWKQITKMLAHQAGREMDRQ